MYYGSHVIQRGLSAERVKTLAQQWDECVSQRRGWFDLGVMVPVTLEHAEVKLRAFEGAPVAFIPDSKN